MLAQLVAFAVGFKRNLSPPQQEKRPDYSKPGRFLEYYPADAVKVDIPFPFGNGRTTVAGASDFQLRHVIFPKCDLAS